MKCQEVFTFFKVILRMPIIRYLLHSLYEQNANVRFWAFYGLL